MRIKKSYLLASIIIALLGYIIYDATYTQLTYHEACKTVGFTRYQSLEQWQAANPGIYEKLKIQYSPYILAELNTPKQDYRIVFGHYTERLPHNVYVVHSQIRDLSLGRDQLLAETQSVFAGKDPIPRIFGGPSLWEQLTFWRNKPYCGNYTDNKIRYAREYATWIQTKI